MGLAFDIKIPDCPNTERGRLLLAQFMQHALNGLAHINADWVMAQWEQGIVPKCCARCAGVRYDPAPALSDRIRLEASPVILTSKVASCGSIAACHTGHKIAEAVMGRLPAIPRGDYKVVGARAPISWDEACERFIVQLKPGSDPTKPMLLHAVCNDDGLMEDPTEGMVRV